MATVNVPAEWVADQVLPPEAPVDYVVFNGDLTKGEPISTLTPDSPAEQTKKSAPKSK
jgi:hypothetical protein